MEFQLKETKGVDKRIIIYNGNESFGFLCNKKELYELYCLLREEFKDE